MAFRFKGRMVAVFLLGITLTAMTIIFWPRAYSSEAKLFVRVGRESVSLDPTATTGQTIALNDSREVEINSVLEILGSRAVLEKVVEKLGPEAVLNPPPPETDAAAGANKFGGGLGAAWNSIFAGLQSIGLADDIEPRERAITSLANSVQVYSPRRSSIAGISVRAKTPRHAQMIVDAVVQAYSEEHLKANRTMGSLEFFKEQSQIMAADLRQAEQRLRDAKNGHKIAAIEQRRTALQDQVSALETQTRDLEGQLIAVTAEVRALEATLATIPDRLLSDQVSGLPNQAADAMRDRLFELQVREQELLAKHTQNHPLVRAAQAQLAKTQAIFIEENQGREQQTSTINPTYQPLELRRLQERGRIESLRAHRENLLEQHAKLHLALADFNTQEMELGELQRQVDLLSANYISYAKNLELARIDHALALGRISNVNVVQPATLVTKPVSPKKPVLLGLGLLLSIGCSLGIALISDFLDRSLHTTDDLEQALELPVLITIPQLSRGQLATSRQPVGR